MQNKKQKLGFLFYGNPNDAKHWSGTIARMYNTLQGSDDFDVEVINVPQGYFEKWIYKATRILSFKKNELSFLMNYVNSFVCNKMIKNSSCDVIFAPAGSKIIYSGKSELKNKKIIYMSDATYHIMLGYYYNHSLHDQKIGNTWEKNAHVIAKDIILASNWAYKDAVSYYKTEEEKVHVLKFGANMNDVGCKVVKASQKQYNLLLVGVDWKRKGIDVAIETVKLLNEAGNNKYTLTIVGVDKPETNYPDYIRFIGRLNKNDEREYLQLEQTYKEADIFILPTKAECAGIVFAEAAMFGLPSFTYSTGGVNDYVEDSVTGRCLNISEGAIEFKNAIEEAILSGNIENYSINARRKYEKELNWGVWLRNFESIYNG